MLFKPFLPESHPVVVAILRQEDRDNSDRTALVRSSALPQFSERNSRSFTAPKIATHSRNQSWLHNRQPLFSFDIGIAAGGQVRSERFEIIAQGV